MSGLASETIRQWDLLRTHAGAWGAGVARAGPAVAGFFINLTPLFTAVLSAAFLGEMPQVFHALAFVLIVSGIVLSSRR